MAMFNSCVKFSEGKPQTWLLPTPQMQGWKLGRSEEKKMESWATFHQLWLYLAIITWPGNPAFYASVKSTSQSSHRSEAQCPDHRSTFRPGHLQVTGKTCFNCWYARLPVVSIRCILVHTTKINIDIMWRVYNLYIFIYIALCYVVTSTDLWFLFRITSLSLSQYYQTLSGPSNHKPFHAPK